MLAPGEVISYLQMCREEGVSLQRGMNFRLRGDVSVILMSTRANAPYSDRIEEGGRVLLYEGHDASMSDPESNPKSVDQPLRSLTGRLTQNGLFMQAVESTKRGAPAELVRVYEKIRSGIWVFNGVFNLVDGWVKPKGGSSRMKWCNSSSSVD
jgi:hypothetical protein